MFNARWWLRVTHWLACFSCAYNLLWCWFRLEYRKGSMGQWMITNIGETVLRQGFLFLFYYFIVFIIFKFIFSILPCWFGHWNLPEQSRLIKLLADGDARVGPLFYLLLFIYFFFYGKIKFSVSSSSPVSWESISMRIYVRFFWYPCFDEGAERSKHALSVQLFSKFSTGVGMIKPDTCGFRFLWYNM